VVGVYLQFYPAAMSRCFPIWVVCLRAAMKFVVLVKSIEKLVKLVYDLAPANMDSYKP